MTSDATAPLPEARATTSAPAALLARGVVHGFGAATERALGLTNCLAARLVPLGGFLAVCVVALVPLAGAEQAPAAMPAQAVVVASKSFGESYLLCELFAQLLESRGIAVERRPGLGATEVAFGAIRSGAIDVYPEYTGTGLLAILHDSVPDSLARSPKAVFAHVARATAERYEARWLPPLGFENTYAIAVRRKTAARYGLRSRSDLARAAPALTGGLTADFIARRARSAEQPPRAARVPDVRRRPSHLATYTASPYRVASSSTPRPAATRLTKLKYATTATRS